MRTGMALHLVSMISVMAMMLATGCTDPCDKTARHLLTPFISLLATGDCGDDDSSDDPSMPPSTSTPGPTTPEPATPTAAPATPTPGETTATPEANTPTPGPLDCSTVCATVGTADNAICGDGVGRAIYWVPCASPAQFVSVRNNAYMLGQYVCYGDNQFGQVKTSWSDSGMWTLDSPQVIYVWESSELADQCRLTSQTWGQAPLMGADFVALDWTWVTVNDAGDTAAYPVWNLGSFNSAETSVEVTTLGDTLLDEWLNPPTPAP